MKKTDEERYHGGDLTDEISSLISLCLGIRLKAGGINRIFGVNELRGRPTSSWGYTQDPVLPKVSDRPILPKALGTHHLENASILTTFPRLSPRDAIALVRAARTYQEAIWIAESAPELSWIMLVSALETVAHRWRTSTEAPLDRLRAAKPNLENILREKGGGGFVLQVAEEITPYMGATKKFIDFILEFFPPPPESRPEKYAQHPWTKQAMKKSLTKIYDYRSRALHGGTPFPAPMCEPPMGLAGAIEERPLGLAASMKGGVWVSKDIPMLLYTFEYITRQVILNWWKSVVS
jgi:hypothetical protein